MAGLASSAPPYRRRPSSHSTQKAKEHQEAWAKHLGVPVEYTNSIGMKFVLIPPGVFMMGSTKEEIDQSLAGARKENVPQAIYGNFLSEGPQHQVKVTKPFYLGKYEATSAQFRRLAEATGEAIGAKEKYDADRRAWRR